MAISYANRGQTLEMMIEYSNKAYKIKSMALVDKVATPWNVNRTNKGVVKHAYPSKKSTVDFIGVTNGKAIAFEAKETRNTTSIPLSNWQAHQIDYLHRFELQGGTAFSLVSFVKNSRIFFLENKDLLDWIEDRDNGKRKSIPYSWFEDNCKTVVSGNGIILDYLSLI